MVVPLLCAYHVAASVVRPAGFLMRSALKSSSRGHSFSMLSRWLTRLKNKSKMARLPDLVRDSKLETRFLPDFSVETVHTYHEPTQRRVVSVSEHWKRQRKIGGGGYSTVWLENCPKASRHGVQVRAVKQIETGGRFARIDFNRELEAIAKFSHPKVCDNSSCLSFLS